jgi:hypothetical protein
MRQWCHDPGCGRWRASISRAPECMTEPFVASDCCRVRAGISCEPKQTRRASMATSSGCRFVPVLMNTDFSCPRTVPIPTPCHLAIWCRLMPVESAAATSDSRRVRPKPRWSTSACADLKVLRSTHRRRKVAPVSRAHFCATKARILVRLRNTGPGALRSRSATSFVGSRVG